MPRSVERLMAISQTHRHTDTHTHVLFAHLASDQMVLCWII